MRISTAEQFQNGIQAIQTQQTKLSRTQQQLATGQRLLAPSDDPAGTVQALALRDGVGIIDQYARNADRATARLSQLETVLSDMGSMLQRARELTVQAANGVQTDQSRRAIASELRQINDALLAAANSRDGAGEYLFAGHRTDQVPFARGADGSVGYHGDAGRRQLALSADRSIVVGASGDLFTAVPRGNGAFTVEPADANQGNARVNTLSLSGGPVPAEQFSLVFTAADAYEVRDADDAVVATGAYVAGQTIDIGGRAIEITGTPEAGDAFAIAPAGSGSVFDMLDQLADGLAAGGDPARAQHRAAMGLMDLDQAIDRLLAERTDLGGRLNAVETQTAQNDAQRLRLQTRLSEIEDLDYAEAISRFQLQQVALQAAQQTYAQLSRLSLFDFIR